MRSLDRRLTALADEHSRRAAILTGLAAGLLAAPLALLLGRLLVREWAWGLVINAAIVATLWLASRPTLGPCGVGRIASALSVGGSASKSLAFCCALFERSYRGKRSSPTASRACEPGHRSGDCGWSYP
jgi:hypothetical protein